MTGHYNAHLKHIDDIIGTNKGVKKLASLNVLVSRGGPLFITDTYIHEDPDPQDILEIVRTTAEEVRWFGIEPKVALLSH